MAHILPALSKPNKYTPSRAHQYLHLTLHQRGWFGRMEKVPSLPIILQSTQQQKQLLLLPSETKHVTEKQQHSSRTFTESLRHSLTG